MSVAFLNAWGLLFKGGVMMWPILLLLIVIMTIAIEKFLHLNEVERGMGIFKVRVFEAIRVNNFKMAMQICEESSSLLGESLKAGILKYGSSRDVLLAAMEDKAAFGVYLLKQRLDLLALVTNVAPILGLLGTINGMSVVFHAVQMRSNALNPLSLGDMSSGIWQALLTTVAGLIVGVVGLAAHSFCASRTNDIIMRLDQSLKEAAELIQGISALHIDEGQA